MLTVSQIDEALAEETVEDRKAARALIDIYLDARNGLPA